MHDPDPYAKIPIGLLDAGLARTPSASPGADPSPDLVWWLEDPVREAVRPDQPLAPRSSSTRTGSNSSAWRTVSAGPADPPGDHGGQSVQRIHRGVRGLLRAADQVLLIAVMARATSLAKIALDGAWPARCMPIKQPGPSSRSYATAAPGMPHIR
jgi:hypothetical protein